MISLSRYIHAKFCFAKFSRQAKLYTTKTINKLVYSFITFCVIHSHELYFEWAFFPLYATSLQCVFDGKINDDMCASYKSLVSSSFFFCLLSFRSRGSGKWIMLIFFLLEGVITDAILLRLCERQNGEKRQNYSLLRYFFFSAFVFFFLTYRKGEEWVLYILEKE